MESQPIIIEQIFNAPITKVWEAITRKEQMQQWYFDLSGFKPEVGFEFHFEAGTENKKYLHLCEITKVIPQRKLAYTWRFNGYAGSSLLTFELLPENDKTRIRLTHEGLESFGTHPDFAKENFNEGWNQIIGTGLKNFVENN